MARRIRSIKPEILDDEKTASLSHLEWRLFVSLWLLADNYGNLRGQPVQIKGAALWSSTESSEQVAVAIDRLVSVGLVHRYVVAGQRYLHIPGWAKHQLVKNPGKPLVPGPEKAEIVEACGDCETPTEEVRKDSGQRTEIIPLDLDHDQRPTTNDRDHEHSASRQSSKRQGRRSKPQVAISDDWIPKPDAIARAMASGLDVSREAERFRNHAVQNDRKCADWDAAFRNWLMTAEERMGGKRPASRQQDMSTQDILEFADELAKRGM